MDDLALGSVDVPSGTLVLLDPGQIALQLRGLIPDVPRVRVVGLPADRPLAVVGTPIRDGQWAGRWERFGVDVADGEGVAEPAGTLVVDFARVLFADEGALRAWVHNDSIDGLADFVFWGRDAAALAAEVGAPHLGDGTFGWTDLPVADAVARGTAAEEHKARRGWRLATDYRPHSHHWSALEQLRRSERAAATIEVGGARMCLAMTSWGDGLYPVRVERSAGGAPLRVRVELWTADLDDKATIDP